MLVLRNPPVLHELPERRQLINTVDCLLFSQTFFKFSWRYWRNEDEAWGITEWGITECKKSLGTSMQVNGSLPALLNRVYLLFFHGWNTIEAGHVHTEGEMRMECGVGASSCCCCCFSFSLPLAPFYSRSRRVCYPVVGASRKPQAVCVPQTEEDEERRRKEKKRTHSTARLSLIFPSLFNQTTQHFLYSSICIVRYVISLYSLFLVLYFFSFIFSSSLLDTLFLFYVDSLIQDRLSIYPLGIGSNSKYLLYIYILYYHITTKRLQAYIYSWASSMIRLKIRNR